MTDCSDCVAPFGLPGRFRIASDRESHKAAAQNRVRCLLQPFARIFSGMPSISLEHTARVASGRYIAFGDAGAAGRDHQLYLRAKANQGGLDRWLLVRYDLLVSDVESVLPQQVSSGGTGDVGAFASGRRITDGKDRGSFHVMNERTFRCAVTTLFCHPGEAFRPTRNLLLACRP